MLAKQNTTLAWDQPTVSTTGCLLLRLHYKGKPLKILQWFWNKYNVGDNLELFSFWFKKYGDKVNKHVLSPFPSGRTQEKVVTVSLLSASNDFHLHITFHSHLHSHSCFHFFLPLFHMSLSWFHKIFFFPIWTQIYFTNKDT